MGRCRRISGHAAGLPARVAIKYIENHKQRNRKHGGQDGKRDKHALVGKSPSIALTFGMKKRAAASMPGVPGRCERQSESLAESRSAWRQISA